MEAPPPSQKTQPKDKVHIKSLYDDMIKSGAVRCVEIKLIQQPVPAGPDGDTTYQAKVANLNLKCLSPMISFQASPSDWETEKKSGDKILIRGLPLGWMDRGTTLEWPTMLLIPGQEISVFISPIVPTLRKTKPIIGKDVKKNVMVSETNKYENKKQEKEEDDLSGYILYPANHEQLIKESPIYLRLLQDPIIYVQTNQFLLEGEVTRCWESCSKKGDPAYIENGVLIAANQDLYPDRVPGVTEDIIDLISNYRTIGAEIIAESEKIQANIQHSEAPANKQKPKTGRERREEKKMALKIEELKRKASFAADELNKPIKQIYEDMKMQYQPFKAFYPDDSKVPDENLPFEILNSPDSISYKLGLRGVQFKLRHYMLDQPETGTNNILKYKKTLNHGLTKAIHSLAIRISASAFRDIYGIPHPPSTPTTESVVTTKSPPEQQATESN